MLVVQGSTRLRFCPAKGDWKHPAIRELFSLTQVSFAGAICRREKPRTRLDIYTQQWPSSSLSDRSAPTTCSGRCLWTMSCLHVAGAGAAGQRFLNTRDSIHQSHPGMCLINGFRVRTTRRDSCMLADPSEQYFLTLHGHHPFGLLPSVEAESPLSRYQFLMLAALLHSGSWAWFGNPETNPHGWDLVKTGAIPTAPSPDTHKRAVHPLYSVRRAPAHIRALRYRVGLFCRAVACASGMAHMIELICYK